MTTISFSTPVTYGSNCDSVRKCLIEKIDDYFFLGGRKVEVIPGNNRGKSEGVSYTSEKSISLAERAIKIASYCTLIIPTFFFFAKVALRSLNAYHLIPARSTTPAFPPQVNSEQSGGIPPRPPSHVEGNNPPDDLPPILEANKPPHLDFDVPTDMPADLVAKYRIKMAIAITKTGQKVHKGFSDLPEYKDSWFEVTYIHWNLYVVTRKKENAPVCIPELLPSGIPVLLSPQEVINLKLQKYHVQDGVGQIYEGLSSALDCYKDSIFCYSMKEQNGQMSYIVTRFEKQ